MPSSIQERHIALPWLARLRWLAVVGQIGATWIGSIWLELELPLFWVAAVVGITAFSNLIVQVWDRLGPPPGWFVPAIILLDVLMLTLLLYFTGGTDNPFSILYVIHVAMAVVVLGGGWAWFVVLLSAGAYAVLVFKRVQLVAIHPIPEQIKHFGDWNALVLVMVLIAYFISRVMRSLRERERELAEARDRASRHEHLASLTTLAAGAAHELGTPLSTIALAAKEMEIASRRGDDAASLAEDAQLIRQEVDRCRAILDRMRVDVLDDAAQRPSSARLGELLDDLRKDLRQHEQSRLTIHADASMDRPISHARVLRRAIGVLLRNAFDASPADGKVFLHFQSDGARIMFEVQDAGTGMSEQVLRRAGEPFFTTKSPGEGMGLGLFLVRLVAEMYRGKFELDSRPLAGTRSRLELPETALRPGGAEVKSDGDPHDNAETEDAGRR